MHDLLPVNIHTWCQFCGCVVGSERQKVTEGEGERLKEAGSINRSLASLGLVIKKLVEGEVPGTGVSHRPHIPYRDSRLTFLLQVKLSDSHTFGSSLS